MVIIKLIQSNPMISQEDLSNIVGMSRSAVAGHIANLINVTSGGVGRNIANNLALLNVPVTLLSVVGNDDEGRRLLEETRKSGVNCEHIAVSNAGHTGIYLAILNDAGDMDVAISGMDILEELNIKYLESKRDNWFGMRRCGGFSLPQNRHLALYSFTGYISQ